MSNQKLTNITFHDRIKVGNAIFTGASMYWQKHPLEESAATLEELQDFVNFLLDIGIDGRIEPHPVPPHLALKKDGEMIYGYVYQALDVEFLPEATQAEREAVNDGYF